MVWDAGFSLAAAAIDPDAALSGFPALAGASACAAALLAAKSLASWPRVAWLSELIGPKIVAGLFAAALIAGAGALGWIGWRQFFPNSDNAYCRLLISEGLASKQIASELERLMTLQVMEIHNQEAEKYLASSGRMTLDALHANILSRVVEEEKAGRLDAGSYSAKLFSAIEAPLVEERYRLEPSASGAWRRQLKQELASDPHEYRLGRRATVFARLPSERAADELLAPGAGSTPWERHQRLIFPVLANNETLNRGPREGIMILQDGLWKAFAPGSPLSYYYARFDHAAQKLVPLRASEFPEYGVSTDVFAKQALDNLGRFLDSEAQVFEVSQKPGGGMMAVSAASSRLGNAASYILLPDFYQRMQKRLKGPFLVLTPLESQLIAGPLLIDSKGKSAAFNSAFLDLMENAVQTAAQADPMKALIPQALLVWEGGMTLFRRDPAQPPRGAVRTSF
jgi:hypothetical protein